MANKPYPSASIALLGPDYLGEGPVWDDRRGDLVRVDISGRLVHRWNPSTGEATSFATPGDVGAAVLCDDNALLVAVECELWRVDLDGEWSWLAEVDDEPGVRFNDCRADPRGRLWAGTLHREGKHGAAGLYFLDPGGELRLVLAQRTLSNGIGWSLDCATMYYVDSASQRIDQFTYDLATGALGDQRLFAKIEPTDGTPDGLTVDADGGVWVCLFGGGRIRRYLPDGTMDWEIELPLTNPTCPAFGGADLRTLYITTARHRLSNEQLIREPLAGALLQLDVGVAGLPAYRFAG